jgi:hypothetical protein
MKRAARVLLASVGLLAVVGAVVAWAESEKELNVLCAGFDPGEDRAGVVRTLETLAWSRFEERATASGTTLDARGPWRLGLSTCRVETADEIVVSRTRAARIHLAAAAGWTAAVGLGLLSAFQVALALGAPLGRMAWGGRSRRLPTPLRAASLVAAALLAVGVPCALELGGIAATLGRRGVAQGLVGVLTLVFVLGVFGNALSSSRTERRVMTPFALLLTGACLAVLLAG